MLSTDRVGPLSAEVAGTYPHDYAVVDVETTGLSASDRVVQVAVTQLNAAGGVVDSWSTLVNPQRHPGPVHIHGLTPDRLAGAPTFDQVGPVVAEKLRGRVLVAHNARFDHDMLANEFLRLGRTLPSEQRLCTHNLARRLDLPVPNYRLRTVADFLGVPAWREHDAAADVTATVEVLRHLLTDACSFGVRLPLARCEMVAGRLTLQSLPSRRAPYVNPGPWQPGQRLVQGMAFVVTGDTRSDRAELFERGYATGLSAMNSVSGKTSLVVCNDHRVQTRKITSARERGIQIVDEDQFLTLLTSVLPGVRNDEAPTVSAVPRQ